MDGASPLLSPSKAAKYDEDDSTYSMKTPNQPRRVGMSTARRFSEFDESAMFEREKEVRQVLKERRQFLTLKVDPKEAIGPNPPPEPAIQAEIDKYMTHQESAMKIYQDKLRRFPDLVHPPVEVKKKKGARKFMGSSTAENLD